MDNHYHLLVETPKANLSLGMRQLNRIYTQNFNRRHNRAGHLFQGRFKAILVEKESYLMELCRYIVLNPVRVKGKVGVGAWKWSSYRATAGLAPVAGVPKPRLGPRSIRQEPDKGTKTVSGICQRRIGESTVGGTQRADLLRKRTVHRETLTGE
jgi:Transposase IS200 like